MPLERADTQSAELISEALVRARGISVASSFDPEPIEQPLVPPPAVADTNLEVEVDLGAELGFQRAARSGPDLGDLASLLTDQDALLGLGLRPDLGDHCDQAIVAALYLLHRYLDRVRDLLAGAVEDLLADQLG